MTQKIRMLLLFGGQSCEHEVSVTSARSMLDAVDKSRFALTLVGITGDGEWLAIEETESVFKRGRVVPGDGVPVSLDYCGAKCLSGRNGHDYHADVDVVFPLLHGPYGEDGTIQGLLELAGIAYVGAGVVGSAVGMDKELMRRAFEAVGLRQTPWRVIRAAEWHNDCDGMTDACESDLSYPVFVKPCNLGSSVGISKAHNGEQLRGAIELALEYDYKVMVEASVENAQEVECAVLGNDDPEASPLGEIIPGAEFYNYETKYLDDKSQLIIPARLSDEVSEQVRRDSITAFKAVEAFGLSRVDFLVNSEGKIFINEINTMPGFTPISMYPKLWQSAGVDYAELINRLIDLGLERQAAKAEIRNY